MNISRPARIVLAIDCSQRLAHLALAPGADGAARSRSFDSTSSERGEAFWDELRALHAEAGVPPDALGAVAVATGPGGFTGLRISIAFAKAVAYVRGIPVVGLPSAAVFAASDAARGGRGPWLVTLAAKEATAWTGMVDSGADEALVVESTAGVVDALGFRTALARLRDREGVLLCDEHLPAAFRAVAEEAGRANPMRPLVTDPVAMTRLAAARLAASAATDPMTLGPIYPREPEAVAKWRERGR